MTLLICIALGAFALFYTLWVPADEVLAPALPTALDHLEEKKKVIYENLRDLNFEFRTGKLSGGDYQQLKTGLQYDLALVMKSIEEEQNRAASERGLAASAAPPPAPAATGDPGRACPKCGHSNRREHKHCSECGAKLLLVLACLALLTFAAPRTAFAYRTVAAHVVNGTTGKPVPGLQVSLLMAGQGMETLGGSTTDTSGNITPFTNQPESDQVVLLLQTEYQGVRYTQPVIGDVTELKVYDANAPASAIHINDRDLIFQPRGGKLLVTELLLVHNESNPPAAYSPAGGSLRFALPKSAESSLQVSAFGAAGVSVPVEAQPDPKRPGVFVIKHAFKPGESRIDISYHLDYPGVFVFDVPPIERVERTRIAVAQGASIEGPDVKFMATEPQSKFGIYSVVRNEKWSVKISGESTTQPAADTMGSEQADSDGSVVSLPGGVAGLRFPLIASILAVLALGFFRLWRQKIE